MKIGRNDPCYCGSGKKYKKCCLEKDEMIKSLESISLEEEMFNPLSYEEVDAYSTEEIINQLKKLGIPFKKEVFLQDVETFSSAQDLSENWFSQYNLEINGRLEDFPWLAAWVLWVRLAPKENLSSEQLEDLVENGYVALEAGDPIKASDEWLKFWKAIQYRINRDYKTLDYLDQQYVGSFFIGNIVQELALTLEDAGKINPIYYEKCIEFCRSFCEYFPEETLIYHNMRRAIADTYSRLGQYDQAEKEFKQLIDDVPDNPWGYIGLADMLFLDKNEQLARAETLYKQAIPLAETHDDGDIEAINERLAMLDKYLK